MKTGIPVQDQHVADLYRELLAAHENDAGEVVTILARRWRVSENEVHEALDRATDIWWPGS